VELISNAAPQSLDGQFSSLHSLFLEVHQGERWAILAPGDREPDLQQAGFLSAPAWK
jgi:hypothetical protein